MIHEIQGNTSLSGVSELDIAVIMTTSRKVLISPNFQRNLCVFHTTNQVTRQTTILFICFFFFSLYNDGHVLHLKSEAVTVRKRMNMVWMINNNHMIPGYECGIICWHCLIDEEKHRKYPTRKLTRPGYLQAIAVVFHVPVIHFPTSNGRCQYELFCM